MQKKNVSEFTLEGVTERLDRINRRLIAVIVLLIVLLVGSNALWVVYESQFRTETTETEVSAVQWGGDTNMVSGGDINCGTSGDGQD